MNKSVRNIELTSLLVPEAQALPARRRARKRFPFGFSLFVILPTLAAAVYYGLIASPIYVSQTQFIVQDAGQPQPPSGFGSLLQGGGLSASSSDAYSLDAYILSRDALQALDKSLPMRQIYSRRGADFIARFPNFYTFFRKSFEYLYWHYANWVSVDFNSTTSITTVSAYAFTAADAEAISQQLLMLSEGAVNRMNDRARAEGLRTMREEVAQLQARSAEIQSQVTQFRNTQTILDPNQASTAATALRAGLESSLVYNTSLLDQLQRSAPHSPQIDALRSRISTLKAQIADQDQKNAVGQGSLADKMAQYTALQLRQQFAQQMLQSAVTSLEAAEVALQQKRIFLTRVSGPNLPDWPQYPYRTLQVLLIFSTALMIYGILRIMTSIVWEHSAY